MASSATSDPARRRAILLEGLRRLEYRGYDSAGIAVINGNGLKVAKAAGKLSALRTARRRHARRAPSASATPAGPPTAPRPRRTPIPTPTSPARIALIHNGIIENAGAIRKALEQRGHTFKSETDTEVLAHLVGEYYQGNLEEAVAAALREVEGAYGIAVISRRRARRPGGRPERLAPAGRAWATSEWFVASDASAILEHTRSVVYLDDGEMVVLTRDGYHVRDLAATRIEKPVNQIDWDLATIERGGFAHFMLKEIFEQPESVAQHAARATCSRKRAPPGSRGLNLTDDEIKRINRIVITACGTSWHAGLIGEYMLEELARIPVEVEYASEFRYRNPVVDDRTLVIGDLPVGRDGRHPGRHPRGQAPRGPDHRPGQRGGLDHRPRSGRRHLPARRPRGRRREHQGVHQPGGRAGADHAPLRPAPEPEHPAGPADHPGAAGAARADPADPGPGAPKSRRWPSGSGGANNALYLGRGVNFPVALEGALKLKEISYIHAEGYPAAEMKHGPIALIDENMPVVFIAPARRGARQDRVQHRRGEGAGRPGHRHHERGRRPRSSGWPTRPSPSRRRIDLLTPILTIVPLQLFSYYVAVRRGCNVDQPRNLAKSVTVE